MISTALEGLEKQLSIKVDKKGKWGRRRGECEGRSEGEWREEGEWGGRRGEWREEGVSGEGGGVIGGRRGEWGGRRG